jgi:predicted NBD/HSP70 family sugar kinase
MTKGRWKQERADLFRKLVEEGPQTQAAVLGVWNRSPGTNVVRDQLTGLANASLLRKGTAQTFGVSGRSNEIYWGFGAAIGHVLAIAVTTARIRIGLLDANLCLVGKGIDRHHDRSANEPFPGLVGEISDAIAALYAANSKQSAFSRAPVAVGIALPLSVQIDSGVITDRTCRDFNVRERMLESWPAGVPRPAEDHFRWDTDVAAAGTGYVRCVRGFDSATVLVVKASAHIRHAVLVDGKPINGAMNRGHALGHLPVARGDIQAQRPKTCEICDCDEHHLDDYASLIGIHDQVLGNPPRAGEAAVQWVADFAQRVADGEAVAVRAMRQSATLLGRSMRSALCLIDPDAVLLTGHLVRFGRNDYYDRVRVEARSGSRPIKLNLGSRPDSDVRPSYTMAGIGWLALQANVLGPREDEIVLDFMDAHGRPSSSMPQTRQRK